jgi:DNA-binding transcriptional LysR family regulator
MELRQLQHFLAVIETGSFHAAAEAMNLTPQAISRSIQRLEEEFTGRLLERKQRDRRRVSPTVFGKLLLPRAQAIVAQARLFHDEMDNYLGLGRELLRIGIGLAACRTLLPQVLRQFAEQMPTAKIQAMHGSTDIILKQLSDGMYDLAICDEPDEIKLGSAFSAEPLFQDHNAFVARATHPLTKAGALDLKDLAAYKWVMPGPFRRSGFELNAMYLQSGQKLKTRNIDTTSIELTLDCLLEEDYVSYVPVQLVAKEIHAGKLVTLPVAGASTSTWPTLLIQRKDSPNSDGLGLFLKILRDESKKMPVIRKINC